MPKIAVLGLNQIRLLEDEVLWESLRLSEPRKRVHRRANMSRCNEVWLKFSKLCHSVECHDDHLSFVFDVTSTEFYTRSSITEIVQCKSNPSEMFSEETTVDHLTI